MKCSGCGKELKDLEIELTNEEQLNLTLSYTKESNARCALKPGVLDRLELHGADLYAYIKANTDALAESIFLLNAAMNQIKEKYGLDKNANVVSENGHLYLHE